MNPSQLTPFNFTTQPPIAMPQFGGANAPAGTASPLGGITPMNGFTPGATNMNAGFPQMPYNAQQNPMQIMQMMIQMLQMLISMLGQLQPAQALDRDFVPVGGGGTSAAPIKSTKAMPIKLPSAAEIAKSSKKSNKKNDPTLQDSLNKIAQDPEGRKLLAEAEKRGVTIEVDDPARAAEGAAGKVACKCPTHQAAKDQGAVVNGVTLSQGDKSRIIVRDPSNIKTIVHELVHAVSTKDGNSQHEEGIADVIGKRVESRITGKSLENPNATYNNKLALYPELGRSNSIKQSLAAIGIDAFG